MFEVSKPFGIEINLSNPNQAIAELEELRKAPAPHYVCFMEGNLLHLALSSQTVRDILNDAALCYPDGISTSHALSRHLGMPVQRVTGPSLILKAIEEGVPRQWRHFFLGGKPGVAEELSTLLKERYPGVQIMGTYSPPFRDMTDDELSLLKQELHEKQVDFLWVALGAPKQEKWMKKHLSILSVPVMLGVGAAFDFHTGHQSWAPRIFRIVGLEWLWRLCTGGTRVFVRNIICVSHVFLWSAWNSISTWKYLFRKRPKPYPKNPG